MNCLYTYNELEQVNGFNCILEETQSDYSLAFGLAIVITLLSLFVISFIYNSLTREKPWK